MKKGFCGDIEKMTSENTNFRKILYTAEHLQLVVMSLLPSEDIGLETHPDNDQFLRFEAGDGKVIINDTKYLVHSGDVVIVPAGSQHNVINTSSENPLKLYTIYTPPHHQDGMVRLTKEEAVKDDPEFDGKTTE
jgi:mannose-6-phosphate isomerase-like protein (cupin superfamily)